MYLDEKQSYFIEAVLVTALANTVVVYLVCNYATDVQPTDTLAGGCRVPKSDPSP